MRPWFRCTDKMCGWVPLFLWMVLIQLTSLQAKVTAPAEIQAQVSHTATLGCNVTLGNAEIISQVRWLDVHNKTVLHYQPGKPGSLTRRDGVELVDQRMTTSVIVIQRTKPENEGCYTCVFDVYPSGQQQGKTCLLLVAQVESVGNKTAVRGNQVTLWCTYPLVNRVYQVLWKKTAEQGDTTAVASYTRQGKLIVESQYQERVKLSQTLGHSQLSVDPVHMEDEGRYTCEYHTYPDGTKSVTACLEVYVLPSPEVSYVTIYEDVIQANCSAVSRPPATLVWNVKSYNHTETLTFELNDGTTMVVSTILLQAKLLDEETVTCTAHHQGLTKNISVALNKTGNTHIILLSVGCAVLLLLICLCICMRRR
ncbi:OX-2 membrane glycoprotein [Trichomycterus rosablanca]|uniref:OX-2 membrane glycoprotein n=1 Tax=Trichomycterus rosablanca TaxID=2290929 RepID=UPI002F35F547